MLSEIFQKQRYLNSWLRLISEEGIALSRAKNWRIVEANQLIFLPLQLYIYLQLYI